MDEGNVGYAWEAEYEKTWEVLQEDEAGSLQSAVADIIQKAKRRQMMSRVGNVKIGMMRHLLIVIDMTMAMLDQDLKPNRLFSTLKLLESFIEEFFDQNPISQVGLLAMKKRRCERIHNLTGNSKKLLSCLNSLRKVNCEGEASLYNALDQALKVLKYLPSHVSREVLILFGSLSTVDPVDLSCIIEQLKVHTIRCSIIGMSAGMHVCQKLCRETQGKYSVILDETHYKALLHEHLLPPVSVAMQEISLVRMGFPQLETSALMKSIICMCHAGSGNVEDCIGKNGYICPQCGSKYCDLPVECTVCGLTLASSAHLARSYHHLFPLEAFEEVLAINIFKKNRFCHGCQRGLNEPNAYRCKKCTYTFCTDCDIFIHESLHSCPGCSAKRNL
ncbi:hypothetical protein HELRODRAFT_185095 [Helobdella robusta]|uniref:General transcription factor IIH subunit n=1 Tax=Helobdella robusta TaxID=6412 RepID=T1FME1_HELRO|nr:hypothetical protein HELRODRAFT_185095 [Helobdella robusta]ESN96704.1 hypothetical protein HELRODRAFT_185095 [Helobdella robusta]